LADKKEVEWKKQIEMDEAEKVE